MKERPILFSGEMVRAILRGCKTQTRRVINPQPIINEHGIVTGPLKWTPSGGIYVWNVEQWKEIAARYSSPYGQPGDRAWQTGLVPSDGWYYVRDFSEDRPVWLRRFDGGLLWGWNERDDPEAIEIEGLSLDTIQWKRPGDLLWVRETWRAGRKDNGLKPSELDPKHTDLWWEADHSSLRRLNGKPGKKRPSIYMPRWASRITLQVTGVRVERVQDISAIDAMWEGIEKAHKPLNRVTIEADPGSSTACAAIADFHKLWDSINAKRGHGWYSNPWVWVVEFDRREQ